MKEKEAEKVLKKERKKAKDKKRVLGNHTKATVNQNKNANIESIAIVTDK